MKAIRWFPLAALVAACSNQSPALSAKDLHQEPVELPDASQRKSVGVWQEGDNPFDAWIAIQEVGGSYYWVVDSWIKAGAGHCTHGIPLVRVSSKEFKDMESGMSYTIANDGTLLEVRDGETVKQYAKSSKKLCGVDAQQGLQGDRPAFGGPAP